MSVSQAAERLGITELPRDITLHDTSRVTTKIYRLPETTVDQTILAKGVGKGLTSAGPCWLQITYWSNDEDSNQELFYSYRKAHGSDQCLFEAPVHSISTDDSHYLASVLSLVLYFRWDARIFDSELTYQISVGNDGFLDYESLGQFAAGTELDVALRNLVEVVRT